MLGTMRKTYTEDVVYEGRDTAIPTQSLTATLKSAISPAAHQPHHSPSARADTQKEDLRSTGVNSLYKYNEKTKTNSCCFRRRRRSQRY